MPHIARIFLSHYQESNINFMVKKDIFLVLWKILHGQYKKEMKVLGQECASKKGLLKQ